MSVDEFGRFREFLITIFKFLVFDKFKMFLILLGCLGTTIVINLGYISLAFMWVKIAASS